MAEEDPSRPEWLRAAQQGDRKLYAALLTAVILPPRRAARAFWREAGAAEIEDIVQETLLALHASRHLYDRGRPFMPFLLGIMRFRGARDGSRRSFQNLRGSRNERYSGCAG